MFPVIALGALVAGGVLAYDAATRAAPESRKAGPAQAKGNEPPPSAAPQSYLVTPVHSTAQPASLVEAINRFIV